MSILLGSVSCEVLLYVVSILLGIFVVKYYCMQCLYC